MAWWRSHLDHHDGSIGDNLDDTVAPHRSVAAAAEGMLAGNAAALFLESGQARAPAWVFLNALAHSSFLDLKKLAEKSGYRNPRGWAATTAHLAKDLLASEKHPAEVERAQREVLIPLELDVLGDRLDRLSSPTEFASLVRSAFEQHRMSHGR